MIEDDTLPLDPIPKDDPIWRYHPKIRIKKMNHIIPWSREMIEEWAKCEVDPHYFITRYVYLSSVDKGVMRMNPLYPYQRRAISSFNNNRFCIMKSSRQSGKSQIICGYIVWYAMFNPERLVALLANRKDNAVDLLSRIRLSIERMPAWIQPGVRKINETTIHLDNGTRIFASATTKDGTRGFSISLLYLDEFAMIPDAKDFFMAAEPSISAGVETKLIVSSTPKGIGNMFHILWDGAIKKDNEFVPIEVNWWDVPGRDEEWKDKQIKKGGIHGKSIFRQEYGCEFLGSGNTLIAVETLVKLKDSIISPLGEEDNTRIYEPPKTNALYVISVDVAEGVGGDFSVATIIKVEEEKMKLVAMYRDNYVTPFAFAEKIKKLGIKYNDATVVIENNNQGSLVGHTLFSSCDYENVFFEKRTRHHEPGIRMTQSSKRRGCLSFKSMVEEDILEVNDIEAISEISTFSSSTKGSYEASEGCHDDIVMALVVFSYFATLDFFKELTERTIRDMLLDKKESEDDPSLAFLLLNKDRRTYDFTEDRRFTGWQEVPHRTIRY